jgi:hypothetical protein
VRRDCGSDTGTLATKRTASFPFDWPSHFAVVGARAARVCGRGLFDRLTASLHGEQGPAADLSAFRRACQRRIQPLWLM